MGSIRNFRYPLFIGAGVLAAGAMFYLVHSGVNSKNTQGAIGQREVYRDGQVNAADVQANPGSAPVATKALLESKEFKALEKNAAFQELMANHSFELLARHAQFLSLLQNEAFLTLSQNMQFQQFLASPAMAELSQWMARNAAQLQSAQVMEHLNSALAAAHAQSLASNQAFQGLFRLDAFQSLVMNQVSSQALSNSAMLNSFASLSQNANFQGLMKQSLFQHELLNGAAANLSSQMMLR
jgi:hypothetical protein